MLAFFAFMKRLDQAFLVRNQILTLPYKDTTSFKEKLTSKRGGPVIGSMPITGFPG